jgi:hypothetical protein
MDLIAGNIIHGEYGKSCRQRLLARRYSAVHFYQEKVYFPDCSGS